MFIVSLTYTVDLKKVDELLPLHVEYLKNQYKMGCKLLYEVHLLTRIAGWIVLISGILMLFLQNRKMLSLVWMQFSLGLFIAIQLFDHFWAMQSGVVML
jgi:hypothetical protein